VDQGVDAVLDRLLAEALQGDVGHREPAAAVRGADERPHCLPAEHRQRRLETEELAVSEEDLDVVGALGDPPPHELVGLLRAVQSGGLDHRGEIVGVALLDSRGVDGAEEVRPIVRLVPPLLAVTSGWRTGSPTACP
jgi:hypothetical protein